ncbi:MAG: glycosyltransferase family 4 protein [Treponema sp.]|nr:glycosyltransferase family 4 protein [Treponema sp.]
MKIGIDTFGCDHGRSGLGSYLISMCRQLSIDYQDIQFELFGSEIDRYTYVSPETEKNPNLTFKSVNILEGVTPELLWHKFQFNSFAKKQKYDAVIFPAGARIIPSKFSVPSIAIISDMVSSVFDKTKNAFLRCQIVKGLSRADCVIAASDFIRNDLLSSGITPNRVEVVHNGIDHSIFYPQENLGIENDVVDIKPFAIKKPYIIYASRMQREEKKHVELIKAFTLFKERTGLPHRLVISGSEGPYSDFVHRAAFTSSAASDIFITGYFPHEGFPELYRGAEICAFPSMNEGVGLPVLEAMATGIPVTCSSSGALKEIAGNNALFFDSNNVEEISYCLERLAVDSELRAKLVASGLEWTKNFKWEKTAAKTMEVVLSVIKRQ